jgi:hypothetical protein
MQMPIVLRAVPRKGKRETMKYILVSALFLVTLFAWAGDEPWKSKPYRRWTEQDVAEVLQASPWAKTVRATGAWRPVDNGPVLLMQDPHAGTTQADNAVHPQELPLYTILWVSSRTVRAALERRAVLRGTMKEDAAQQDTSRVLDSYMILVKAADMVIFESRGEAAFAKVSYIQLKKSKQKILPSRVTFFRGSDGQSVTGAVFYFSKKEATISADEKEIAFYLQVGDTKFLTSFNARQMTDAQGEDL